MSPLDTIRGGSSDLQCPDLAVDGQVSVRGKVTSPVEVGG